MTFLVALCEHCGLGKAGGAEGAILRELLYDAADHFKRGKALAEGGDVRGALRCFEDALRDLHAVKPQRMRDVLLAYVHLSRYELAASLNPALADSDLRLGYSYARTTREPAVRKLAETLWAEHLKTRGHREVQTVGRRGGGKRKRSLTRP